MKRLVIFITIFLLHLNQILAQCAMCKAGVESSLESTNEMQAINHGVLYVLFFSFLGMGFFAYLIYKNAKN